MHKLRHGGYWIPCGGGGGTAPGLYGVACWNALSAGSELTTAQQQSTLSSKSQAPDPTVVRLTFPFKMSRPGQTCPLVPGVRQVSVGLCLLGQKGAGQQRSAGCGRPSAGSHRLGHRPRVMALGLGRTGVQQGRRMPGVRAGRPGWRQEWGREPRSVVATCSCSTPRWLRHVCVVIVSERGRCQREMERGRGGVPVGVCRGPPAACLPALRHEPLQQQLQRMGAAAHHWLAGPAEQLLLAGADRASGDRGRDRLQVGEVGPLGQAWMARDGPVPGCRRWPVSLCVCPSLPRLRPCLGVFMSRQRSGVFW